jgi:hypothetical protein
VRELPQAVVVDNEKRDRGQLGKAGLAGAFECGVAALLDE